MEHLTQNNAPTPESFWAGLQESRLFLSEKFAETDRMQKENERILSEKFAETDRLQKENERILSEKFAETDRMQKENERILSEKFAETDRLQKENERILSEKFAESERLFKENWANYEKRMKRMENDLGSWSINHGSFAEEYFIDSLEDGEQNFFGEQFDDMEYCLKPKSIKVNGVKLQDKYDIVLYNHSSVAIIEVKFKAHENDIAKTMKKAETFRILCPEYKDYKIYLGLASMSFYQEVEQKCTEHGIAIIKQVGDMVVINDAHLKVF